MSDTAQPAAAGSAPATGDAASAQQPFCVHCISGDLLPGESKGSEVKLGPYNTYVASPASSNASSSSSSSSSSVGIIFACDAFGLALKNNKILADTLADKLGVTVYVPDYFHGDPVKPEVMNGAPGTAKEVNAQSFFQKATSGLKMVGMAPWFIRNRPSTKYEDFANFVKTLKEEKKLDRLGAVGYCYGGKIAAHANVHQLVQASVLLHPSFIGIDEDVKPLKSRESSDSTSPSAPSLLPKLTHSLPPRSRRVHFCRTAPSATLFLCAESDPIFPEKLREQARAALAARGADAPAHEFVLYEK